MRYPLRYRARRWSFLAAAALELFSDPPKGLGEHMAAWKFVYTGESFADVAGGLRQGAVFDGMART